MGGYLLATAFSRVLLLPAGPPAAPLLPEELGRLGFGARRVDGCVVAPVLAARFVGGALRAFLVVVATEPFLLVCNVMGVGLYVVPGTSLVDLRVVDAVAAHPARSDEVVRDSVEVHVSHIR